MTVIGEAPMEEYKRIIIQAKKAFSENDLFVGKKLADGCYNQHLGYEFTKRTLYSSDNKNDLKIYRDFDTTKEDYWSKLNSFDDVTLALYLKALTQFCHYLGYD